MASLNKPLLIICVGNPARGDDAIGPMIAVALRDYPPTADLPLIEEFQLQPELVEDLHDYQQVLIIDAQTNTQALFTLETVQPQATIGWCSHALSPQQLAGLYQHAYQRPPPTIITLGIRSQQFELGTAPASESIACMDTLVHILGQLVEQLGVNNDVPVLDFLRHRLLTSAEDGTRHHA